MSAGNPMLHEALRAVAAQAETLTSAGPVSIAFYHWVLGEGLPTQQSAGMAREQCEELSGGGRSIHAVAAQRQIVFSGFQPFYGGAVPLIQLP